MSIGIAFPRRARRSRVDALDPGSDKGLFDSGPVRCPDEAGGAALRCDQALMSICPADPVANACLTPDDFHDLTRTSRGANLM
jgi:hypothetical protein